MVQLIVLGYVPGTSIQITFNLLAQIAAVGVAVYLAWLLHKEEKFVQQQLINLINQKTI